MRQTSERYEGRYNGFERKFRSAEKKVSVTDTISLTIESIAAVI